MSLLKKPAPLFKQLVRLKSSRKNLGKPPGVARNLEQRLAELHYQDPAVTFKVDIGFSAPVTRRKDVLHEKVAILKKNKNDAALETLSRTNQLVIPADEVENEWCYSEHGRKQLRDAAEHYGVFRDLYGDAYFTPVLPLTVDYLDPEGKPSPVYRGNVIMPSEAKEAPQVHYKSSENALWTLLLTTPDGHLTSPTGEYALWMKGNIRGNNVSGSGDEVFSYIQPFPVKGIGYCRYIFVLYRQAGPMDYSSLVKNKSKGNEIRDPAERDFCTLDFYRKRQDSLTPAGLAFYQSPWDSSVTEVFHKQFQQPAPIFEYDFKPHYYTPQKWFPLRQPFNLYMDRYREEKDIALDWLKRKLQRSHPFKLPEQPLPFPAAVRIPRETPSWLRNEIKKERLGWARVNDYS